MWVVLFFLLALIDCLFVWLVSILLSVGVLLLLFVDALSVVVVSVSKCHAVSNVVLLETVVLLVMGMFACTGIGCVLRLRIKDRDYHAVFNEVGQVCPCIGKDIGRFFL